MARLDGLFKYLKSHNGSDLHLAAGIPPRLRLRGEVVDVEGGEVLDDGTLRGLLKELTTAEQWKRFETS
ncbi:MAG: type IV pili twitching motility protein PilT, partial [Deltaproteobacteria bacterium]|nr:type IV pili twitching motility protein PilT [Deltaproteobacteria bacterium]